METDKAIINECIERNMDEAVQTLKSLISIKSTAGDPVEGCPFGQGVQDAFQFALAKGEEMGFSSVNVDNYGGHIEWKGVNEEDGPAGETLGMLAHLDVVPEGEGWEHGPYSADEADGFIWGRGAVDDKGPLVASLYAMKSLKDAGYVPARNVRLILGLDEETNWIGMEYYLDHQPKPDLGFSPDANFPVLNGEKGIMDFKIAAKLRRDAVKGLELRKLSGGTAVNMVPAFARAVVHDQDPAVYDRIREMAESYEMTTGRAVAVHKMGKSLEITARGRAAHGSTPDQGVNAVSILIGFLGQLNFVNEDLCRFFDFYNDCIGTATDGSGLGCAMSDDESGALTMNVGIVEYDGRAVSVRCDVRYPVTRTSDEVYSLMMPDIDKYDVGVLKGEDRAPVYFSPDSPMIKTFLDCYRDVTGDTESGPIVIGGGTYARTCGNTVAFGAMFPGDPEVEHKPDERISLERFGQTIRIYAEAIRRLTQPDFAVQEQ